MGGNLQVAYDASVNFVTVWNQMFVDNDFINGFTGKIDPRHMYGTSSFDVSRWNGLNGGTQRSNIRTFITTLLMPGIPLVCVSLAYPYSSHLPAQLHYGKEQDIHLYDNTADYYLFGSVPTAFSSNYIDIRIGRQATTSTTAWQRCGIRSICSMPPLLSSSFTRSQSVVPQGYFNGATSRASRRGCHVGDGGCPGGS